MSFSSSIGSSSPPPRNFLSDLSSSQREAVLQAGETLLPYVISAQNEYIKDATLEAYFDYDPSKNAAIVTFFILLVLTVFTFILPFFSHMWVLLLVPLSTLLLLVGYLYRLRMLYDPDRSDYRAMQFFLVVGPLILAAAIYAALGELISASWVPIIYVLIDIIIVVVQATGVKRITSATDKDEIDSGLNILIIGKAMALLENIVFLLTIFVLSKNVLSKFAPIMVTLLVLATLLMLVRNVYRFQEFISKKRHLYDDSSEREKSEKIFYAFDLFPILAIVVILSVFQLV
jgi:putative effector of murein hydrolase